MLSGRVRLHGRGEQRARHRRQRGAAQVRHSVVRLRLCRRRLVDRRRRRGPRR